MSNRERWSSKTGFILAAAGSAVGLGNIWKFPYIAGENGGAAFLFIYLICILMIGLPILNVEILLGRTTQKNPVGAFKALHGNSYWKYVGGLGVLASFTILSFYSIVGGWSVAYTFEALKGTFSSFGTPQVAADFFNLKNSNPMWVIGYHTAFFLMIVGIILSGVREGLEKASKFLMPLLFGILMILVVQGLMLPGADRGISFLFNPDWSKINPQTFLLALGHAFFTLSLGMGAMMSAVLQAPLAALVALMELTHNPEIILPSMATIVIANISCSYLFKQDSAFIEILRKQGMDYQANPITQALNHQGVTSLMHDDISHHHDQDISGCQQAKDQGLNWMVINNGGDQINHVLHQSQIDLNNELIGSLTEAAGHPVTQFGYCSSRATLKEAWDLCKKMSHEQLLITDIDGSIMGLLPVDEILKYTHKE